MSFSAPKFTNAGKIAMLEALSGKELKFTKMQLGDGELGSASLSALTALIHPIVTVAVNDIKVSNGYATVSAVFKNSDVENGFYWREIGLFVQDPDDENEEILYCVQNAGELAEYIPSANSSVIEKVVKIAAVVGNADNVTALIDNTIVLVKREEFVNHIHAKNPHAITYEDVGAAKNEHIHKFKDVELLPELYQGLLKELNNIHIKIEGLAAMNEPSSIAFTDFCTLKQGVNADGDLIKIGNRLIGTIGIQEATIQDNTIEIADIKELYYPVNGMYQASGYYVDNDGKITIGMVVISADPAKITFVSPQNGIIDSGIIYFDYMYAGAFAESDE